MCLEPTQESPFHSGIKYMVPVVDESYMLRQSAESKHFSAYWSLMILQKWMKITGASIPKLDWVAALSIELSQIF